jgi:serine/threonine protein kinase
VPAVDASRFHLGGTIAGRYRIERALGEGAMGAVVAARHLSLDETVAVKFPRRELCRDPLVVAHFTREAKALARIKSDHVAHVLDVGVSLAVGPYIVMEYLEGTDLGSVLQSEGPLSPSRAVEYVLQACEALVAAHAEGITHRDIKPENLFLARRGEFETLKVLDFGISQDAPQRRLLDGVAPADEGDAPMGTPEYMAPERIRSDRAADHRSDIWSLGIVLHELVTGRVPFDGDSIPEICARVLEAAPLPLERDENVLPAALRAIVTRCLQRDPAERYQSVQELAAALMPLETMTERFRGRLTGSFKLPKGSLTLADAMAFAAKSGEAPPQVRRAPEIKLGRRLSWWLRDGLLMIEDLPISRRLRVTLDSLALSGSVSAKSLALAVSGLVLLILAVAYLGSINLMRPPPSARPVRAKSAAPLMNAVSQPPAPIPAPFPARDPLMTSEETDTAAASEASAGAAQSLVAPAPSSRSVSVRKTSERAREGEIGKSTSSRGTKKRTTQARDTAGARARSVIGDDKPRRRVRLVDETSSAELVKLPAAGLAGTTGRATLTAPALSRHASPPKR